MAEPGKEITTSKLTMCLKYKKFQPLFAYKLRAFKKNKMCTEDLIIDVQHKFLEPEL